MNFFKALFPQIFLITILPLSCEISGNSESDFQRKQTFTEDWYFHRGDSASMASANWRELDLPHDWSIEGEFSPNNPAGVGGGALPGGLGWYKKTFSLKPGDSTKLTTVIFDGVYHNSDVWINGNYLGKRPNGYIGFQYNLTPYLNYGDQTNELLVKVDNTQDMDWPRLELRVYAAERTNEATGKVFLPDGDGIQTISVSKRGNIFEVTGTPLSGKITFRTQWQK